MKDQVEQSLLELAPSEDGFVATYRFKGDLPVFLGHFPGSPIVPGVFLIESVRLGAERSRRASLRIATVSEAKFLGPVLPDDTIEISARVEADGELVRCDAVVRAGTNIASRIRLRLCDVSSGAKSP